MFHHENRWQYLFAITNHRDPTARPNAVKMKSRYFAGFCGLKHIPCMSNLLGIFVLGHYGALFTQNDENGVIFKCTI